MDETVAREKEKAAEELLASIENLSINSVPRSLMDERERIEEHFSQVSLVRMSVSAEVGSEAWIVVLFPLLSIFVGSWLAGWVTDCLGGLLIGC